MDQDAPDQQELATRYLSGELTLREAREFEKFCRRHPDILAALPIPVRLKARLAPCDQGYPETPAAATPERHTTAPDEALLTDDGPDSRFGYPGRRALAIGGLVAALAVTIAIATSLAGRTNQLTEQISALERAAQARSLRAPSSLQAFSVAPDPAGPPAVPQIAMRWPDPPQLIELSIDVSQGRYTA
ncbi:MAG TPA: hypothetical protein VLT59_04905, partial [Steroidobacteraceae bacterium]|nr:hypothetical protein [Steroidobacteraceae bacterium]